MFSLVFVLCNLQEGICQTKAPIQVFQQEEQCQTVGQGVFNSIITEIIDAKEDPNTALVLYHCVNWGDYS